MTSLELPDDGGGGKEFVPVSRRREFGVHPSLESWKLFLDRRVDPQTGRQMAAHLENCAKCGRIYLALPGPPYRALGRPVPPYLGLPVEAAQAEVCRLVECCSHLHRTGGVLPVMAQWPNETLLFRTLAVAASRMKRWGLAVCVEGFIYGRAEPPSRPDADVAILVGASMYSNLGSWMEERPGKVVLLAGCERGLRGTAPYRICSRDESITIRAMSREREAARAALSAEDPAQVQGMLSAAMGCDLPPGFFASRELPPAFAFLENPNNDARLAWSTVICGHRLAACYVGAFFKSTPKRFADETDALIHKLQAHSEDGRQCAARIKMRLAALDRHSSSRENRGDSARMLQLVVDCGSLCKCGVV